MSRRSSPPLFVHLHHLNCVLLDPGSGCASPLSIEGVAFGVVTWLTSRISMVQVGQMVLDRYKYDDPKGKGNGQAKPIDEAKDATGDMD